MAQKTCKFYPLDELSCIAKINSFLTLFYTNKPLYSIPHRKKTSIPAYGCASTLDMCRTQKISYVPFPPTFCPQPLARWVIVNVTPAPKMILSGKCLPFQHNAQVRVVQRGTSACFRLRVWSALRLVLKLAQSIDR